MKNTGLRNLYEECVKGCSCKKYYCTTCGGISNSTSHLLDDIEIKNIYGIELLSLKPCDFNRRQDKGFPKEQQCSYYVLFLKSLIEQANDDEQAELFKAWSSDASNLKNDLIDGIGYYLVPDSHKKIWRSLLLERAQYDESIKETLRIRY
jgi:hypothetical protein